jgi:hypothetical protein
MFGIVLAPFTIGTALAVALLIALRRWTLNYVTLGGMSVISAFFVALCVVNYVEGGWPLIGKSMLWLIPAEFIWISAFTMLFERLSALRRP